MFFGFISDMTGSFVEDKLTETEMAVFKRGRNFHTSTTPKRVSNAEYHTATGLECLFGYLHLSGQNDRAKELFEIIWKNSENV